MHLIKKTEHWLKSSQKVIPGVWAVLGGLFFLLIIFLDRQQALRDLEQRYEKLVFEFAKKSNQIIANSGQVQLWTQLIGETGNLDEKDNLLFFRIIDEKGSVIFSLEESEQGKITPYPEDMDAINYDSESSESGEIELISGPFAGGGRNQEQGYFCFIENADGRFLLRIRFEGKPEYLFDWLNFRVLFLFLFLFALVYIVKNDFFKKARNDMRLSQKVFLVIWAIFGTLFFLLSAFLHFLDRQQAQRNIDEGLENLVLEFSKISNQMISNLNPGGLWGQLTGEAERRNEREHMQYLRIIDEKGIVIFSMNEMEEGEITPFPNDPEILKNYAQIIESDSVHAFSNKLANCWEHEQEYYSVFENTFGRYLLRTRFNKKLRVPLDWFNIGFLFAVLSLVSIGFIFILRWMITKPLEELDLNARQIAEGNSQDFYFSRNRRDEIGKLANSLHILVQELKSKTLELAEKEKLAVLGRGTGRLTHNISNLLNPLDYYFNQIKNILNHKKMPDSFNDSFDIIEKHVNLIKTDLNRLRKAIPQPPQCEPYPVSIIIDAALSRMLKPANVKIEKDLGPESMEVNLDPEQMTIAMYNLIQNAFQAMEPDGGTLTIRVELIESNASILIEDTGCGISIKQQKDIFQFFTTTKRNGMGIGLPSASEIIRNHGGAISLESKVGKGTRFLIRLPVIYRN